jgi:hypothetical protein
LKYLPGQRFLAIYSGVLTVVLSITVWLGIAKLRNPKFETITARRINIIEPDGTVRLTISNRADFPDGWERGKEYPRPDRKDAAGILFMNEEGTEQGGLIWGAHQHPDGSVESHAHLSFDQYEANQIFALDAGREGNEKFSRITIADQGDYPVNEKREAFQRIMKLPQEQQEAAWNDFFAKHPAYDTQRLSFGRAPDGSVGLELKDTRGRSRILLSVQPGGEPTLKFLDASGKVMKEIPSERK